MSAVFRKVFLGFSSFALLVVLSVSPVLGGQAVLSWFPNAEPDLAGYVLYYKDDSNNLPLTKTQYTEKIVISGQQTGYTKTGLGDGTHRFALTAFDSASNESGLSEVVYKILPSSQVLRDEPTTGGGGGCGLVLPRSGGSPPAGPGDAAEMLILCSVLFILFLKKAFRADLHPSVWRRG